MLNTFSEAILSRQERLESKVVVLSESQLREQEVKEILKPKDMCYVCHGDFERGGTVASLCGAPHYIHRNCLEDQCARADTYTNKCAVCAQSM